MLFLWLVGLNVIVAEGCTQPSTGEPSESEAAQAVEAAREPETNVAAWDSDKMRAVEALALLEGLAASPRPKGRRLCEAQGHVHGANEQKFDCKTGYGAFGITYEGNVAKYVAPVTNGKRCPTFKELGANGRLLPPEEAAAVRKLVEEEEPELLDAISFETLCIVQGK